MRPTLTGMQDSCPFLTALVGWDSFLIDLQNSSEWHSSERHKTPDLENHVQAKAETQKL